MPWKEDIVGKYRHLYHSVGSDSDRTGAALIPGRAIARSSSQIPSFSAMSNRAISELCERVLTRKAVLYPSQLLRMERDWRRFP